MLDLFHRMSPNPPELSLTRTHPRALVGVLAALAMIGALSIDTYLPALPAITRDLSTTAALAQQTLTAFLFGYACMTLFYGTLSDSFGRRPVIIVSLVLYLAASFGCALAPNLAVLLTVRFLQGLCAGAGNVVGRAMIGDLFEGAEAQRIMAFVSMVFGLAPAIAPILGGWLQSTLGWRAIFWFISAFTLVLLIVCLLVLRESLEPQRRHPFHFKVILANYWEVGGHVRFLLLCVGNAFTFSGVSIYIGSASPFVYTILHLNAREFAWLFIPLIGGMTIGSMLASRASHQLCPKTIIRAGYALMLAGALANVAYNFFFTAAIPWAVVPLFVYCIGMAFGAPAMSMQILEMFPQSRGLASSLMAFTFMAIFTLVSGVVCPLIFNSALYMALATMAGLALSALCWWLGAPRGSDDTRVKHLDVSDEVPLEL